MVHRVVLCLGLHITFEIFFQGGSAALLQRKVYLACRFFSIIRACSCSFSFQWNMLSLFSFSFPNGLYEWSRDKAKVPSQLTDFVSMFSRSFFIFNILFNEGLMVC